MSPDQAHPENSASTAADDRDAQGAATATSAVSIPNAPPLGSVPVPPDGYAPAPPRAFRNAVPRRAELTALPQALVDLASFGEYDAMLGATAAPHAELFQALTTSASWTSMCRRTQEWAKYASLMEGLSWERVRRQLETVRPAFALALKRNPKLAEQYPGLARLLAAPSMAALEGAAARRANKNAVAEGRLPIHGKIGKKRQRAAERAALAARPVGTEPRSS